ncbi:putative calcium-binding protein CML35 [Raphanus sativus]|uniref:Probable calcium-binding protein CML35 n=1 Tax=Raphanus sativus TaxID=3726 RepID=A0A6J0JX66_RAPSA|nr:probable calcium-binding protein CML35 [Raphanus sativus]KAJ4892097.1 putative calcium-binding protein CML35 [Raphanus sativus]
MKLAASLKRMFRSKSKASSSVSRSEPSSFSSSSSSDGDLKPGPAATPVSVLLPQNSGDFYTELVQAFKLIDRDDDGVVSRRDLAALLSRLSPEPPSPEEVSMMLREVDAAEGCISLEELASRVAGTSAGEGCVETEEMREVFEFFDADRDGRISAEELHRVFGVIGDERCTLEECVRMIATVDRNGDGFVRFDDFCRMMELPGSKR